MQTKQAFVEWPTLVVLIATYLTLGLATTWLAGLSLPLAIVVTALAVAQFSSLQHEVLHGHPFKNRWLSEASVFAAVTVYVPYLRFKDTHLAHHHDPVLTDPYDDPESNFMDPKAWAALPQWHRALLKANNTLAGRILLGPAVSVWSFAGADFRKIWQGDRPILAAWVLHGLGLALVFGWLWATPGMPVWAYLLAAYLGFGLLKIRTFLEHRAHDLSRARSVVIEDRGFFALLFLNNNYHSVHHSHPGLAWYHLPGVFARNRDHYLARNDGYLYRSYRQIFRLHLFRAKDQVPHPSWQAKDKPDMPV